MAAGEQRRDVLDRIDTGVEQLQRRDEVAGRRALVDEGDRLAGDVGEVLLADRTVGCGARRPCTPLQNRNPVSGSATGVSSQYVSGSLVNHCVTYTYEPKRSDWRIRSAPASSSAWTICTGAETAGDLRLARVAGR